MADNFNKNRIVKNSVLLYARMAFTMWVNLYATRLVLQNLGVEDMGVYGVVGSIVGFFSILTGGVTGAIQRFITYELGRGQGNVTHVFCTSMNVILLMAVAMVLLLESVGVWVLTHRLNIPQGSMQAAFWVFQLSILSCVFDLISVPYNALVIAHEKMDAFAGISILQVVLNCSAAYCLSLFADHRLVIYAALITLVGILIRVIYQVYCHYQFTEVRYRFYIDRPLLKQIGKYAGVTTVSHFLYIVYSQGIVFVINWTFGVAINAVYSIAIQVKNSVLSFALNLFKAVSPQITKTYAAGDLTMHKKLVYSGCKMETYMIFFIMIPFLFRTDYIMHLWLGQVPEYAVAFVQCSVLVSLFYATFEPVRTAVFATAQISRFNIIPNAISLLILPISYLLCKATGDPVCMIICFVAFELVVCLLRIYYASKVTILRIPEMVRQIVFPCLMVAAFSSAVCYGLAYVTPENLWGLLVLLLVNSLALAGFIYGCGLNPSERRLATAAISAILLKIRKR
jgi:O-antigen/teichoic acid export membrane protein